GGDDGQLRRRRARVHPGREARQLADAPDRVQHHPFDPGHVDQLVVAGDVGTRPDLPLVAEDILVRKNAVPPGQHESPAVIDRVDDWHDAPLRPEIAGGIITPAGMFRYTNPTGQRGMLLPSLARRAAIPSLARRVSIRTAAATTFCQETPSASD